MDAYISKPIEFTDFDGTCIAVTLPATATQNSTYTTNSIYTTINSNHLYGKQLSLEEQKELKSLREVYDENLKVEKLNKFKQLSSTLRQHIVNNILWDDACDEINNTYINKSDRYIELQGETVYINNGSNYGVPKPRLPAGLSKEELIRAHNEACMEEEIQ
jgi:hypothetical protein